MESVEPYAHYDTDLESVEKGGDILSICKKIFLIIKENTSSIFYTLMDGFLLVLFLYFLLLQLFRQELLIEIGQKRSY